MEEEAPKVKEVNLIEMIEQVLLKIERMEKRIDSLNESLMKSICQP